MTFSLHFPSAPRWAQEVNESSWCSPPDFRLEDEQVRPPDQLISRTAGAKFHDHNPKHHPVRI